MAVASPVRIIPQVIDSMSFHSRRSSDMMSSDGEVMEETPPRVEDKIYVAVGKEVKESKSTLLWALHNSGGRKICILHIHQPAQMIPLNDLGVKFPASKLKEQEVRAYRELERQKTQKLLDEYLQICQKAGVRAEKVRKEMEHIEKGIVELISQCKIRKLVMGAAADKNYSKKMTELKSKKAMYVRLQAPVSCHIWFVCKNHLIYTREGSSDGSDMEFPNLVVKPSPNSEIGQSNYLRSRSAALEQFNQPRLSSAEESFRRARSVNFDFDLCGGGSTSSSSPDVMSSRVMPTPQRRSDAQSNSDIWEGMSRVSNSGLSMGSSSDMVGELYLTERTKEGEDDSEVTPLPQMKKDVSNSTPPRLMEGDVNDELYLQLKQAMQETENTKREAFEESLRRGRAEKDALDAHRRAKAAERLYNDEKKQRTEIEEELIKEREELKRMKKQCSEATEELCIALEQRSSLEGELAESNQIVKELKEKIVSAVTLLEKIKKERDDLETERDMTLRLAEELRQQQAEEASSSQAPQFFTEFSFSEIEEATNKFDPSLKIGEGGYGSIFKGQLRQTTVAIKMLHSHSMQGPSEFQQEVDVLSKLRHPNLVTLIGACPESWTLIYEYLENGSLEDRLSCRDNSPPLSWQTRIRIATELCSVLIFLHSCKPNSIIHGDLKPANILLDTHLVSKLSDFGICRLIAHPDLSTQETTICLRTDPKGTFAYMDPEFLSTGELTPKSDVYSFGIILLRLLTGRTPLGITKEVQYALDKGNLDSVLDPSAGEWPFVQAKQLAYIGLKCCELNRKSRPDLVSDVWRVLEPMRVSCGSASSFRQGSQDNNHVPSYFMCPIFHEIMQDPQVAADGFTYEGEAIRGWLDGGNDTSPMTNLKLAHSNLVPNHALRSAIQEWLQQC
ncbi:Protein kinase domain [Dillenia turbinata]|uniref:RING-type E3 ubiquitin transferase n=1 Tax=Dillenia turbinata TaxID=194707 RepID=A0AAN8YZX6_9MAGN